MHTQTTALLHERRTVNPPRRSSSYFRDYAASAGCALDDEQTWKVANPGPGRLPTPRRLQATLLPEDARGRVPPLPPPPVGHRGGRLAPRWRLGSVPRSARTEISDGAEVMIALDGSFFRDRTALVVATVADRPYVDLYRLWEAPRAPGTGGFLSSRSRTPSGRLPRWRVLEVTADPTAGNARWRCWTQTASHKRVLPERRPDGTGHRPCVCAAPGWRAVPRRSLAPGPCCQRDPQG